MADRETAITHLQIIHTWAEFARERDLNFFTAKHLEDIAQWAEDAIKLLKEQEAIVRCNDCIHCEYPNAEREWCKKGHLHRNAETWYCADGERKET